MRMEKEKELFIELKTSLWHYEQHAIYKNYYVLVKTL